MKSLLAVLLLAGFVGAVEPPAYRGIPEYTAAVEQSPNRSSVYVTVDLGGGSESGGTGTVIASEGGRSLILTCAHVVEGGTHPIKVTYWHGGKPYISPVTYLGGSPVRQTGPNSIQIEGPDLALLCLGCELRAVAVSSAMPVPGSPVTLHGFGGADANGTEPLAKSGVYRGDADFRTMAGTPVAITSIATTNGDSGAGVLDTRGELVAVHWGGGVVRLDTIHAFTVRTLRHERCLFPRLRDRLAARRIARSLAPIAAAPLITPIAPLIAPIAPPITLISPPIAPPITLISPPIAPPRYCPNGSCPLPSAPVASPPVTIYGASGGCVGGQCPAPRGRRFWRR